MAGDRAANRAADQAIARELRLLGQSSPTPTTDLSTAVLAVIGSEPAPVRRSAAARVVGDAVDWIRARWRAAVAVLLGAVVAVGAVTPVGATVARWFTFGGVEVVQGPNQPTGSPPPVSPSASASPSPSRPASPADLAAAAAAAGFPLQVPAELGPPDTVSVDTDRDLVTMTWPGGIRLDQFAGQPHPVFVKKYAEDIEFVTVGAVDGLWFAEPHELVYLDADGVEQQETVRTAAETLLWTDGPITLRLEGTGSLDRALQIARSTR